MSSKKKPFVHKWYLFLVLLSSCCELSRCQGQPTRLRPRPAFPQSGPDISNRRQRMWMAQVDYTLHRLDTDFGVLKSAMSNMERRLTMTLTAAMNERLQSMGLVAADEHKTQFQAVVEKLDHMENEITLLKKRETLRREGDTDETLDGDERSSPTGKPNEIIGSELFSIRTKIEALNNTVMSHSSLLKTSLVESEDHEIRLTTLQAAVEVVKDTVTSQNDCDACADVLQNLTEVHDHLALQSVKIENISRVLDTAVSLTGVGRINESSGDTKLYEYGGVVEGGQFIDVEIYDDYGEDEESVVGNRSKYEKKPLHRENIVTENVVEENLLALSVSDLEAKLETVFAHLVSQQSLLDNLTNLQTKSAKQLRVFSNKFQNITAAFRRAQIRDAELNGGMRSNRRMLEGVAKSFREIFQDDRRQKLAIVNLRRRIRNIEGIDFDEFAHRTDFLVFKTSLNESISRSRDTSSLGSEEVKSLVSKEVANIAGKVTRNRDSLHSLANVSRTLAYLESEIKSFSPDIHSIGELRDDVLGLVNLRNLVLRNSGDVNKMHDDLSALQILVKSFNNNLLDLEADVKSTKDYSEDLQVNQEESHTRVGHLDDALAEIRNQFMNFEFLITANMTEARGYIEELYSNEKNVNEELSVVKTGLDLVNRNLEDHKRTSTIADASNQASQLRITNKMANVEQSLRRLDEEFAQMQSKTNDDLYELRVASNENTGSLRQMRNDIVDVKTSVDNIKQHKARHDVEEQSTKERLGNLENNINRQGSEIEKTKDRLQRAEYGTTRLDERILSIENQVRDYANQEQSLKRGLMTQQNATIAVRKHVLQNYENLQSIDFMMKQVVSSVRRAEERYKSQREEMRELLTRSTNQSRSITILRQRLQREYSDSNVTRQLFRKITELHRMIDAVKRDINVTLAMNQAKKSRFQSFEENLSDVQSSIWKCENENLQQKAAIERVQVDLGRKSEAQQTFSENLRDTDANILQMQQSISRQDADIVSLKEAKHEVQFDVRSLRHLAENAFNGTRETKSWLSNVNLKIGEVRTQENLLSSALDTVKKVVATNSDGLQEHGSMIAIVERKFSENEGHLQGIQARLTNLETSEADRVSLHDRVNRLSSSISKFERKSSDHDQLASLIFSELNTTVRRINRLQSSIHDESGRRLTRENKFVSHINEIKRGLSEVNSTAFFNEIRLSGLRGEMVSWREFVENMTDASQVFRRQIETSLVSKMSKDEAKISIDILDEKLRQKENGMRRLESEMAELTRSVKTNLESQSKNSGQVSTFSSVLAIHETTISQLVANSTQKENDIRSLELRLTTMESDNIAVRAKMISELKSSESKAKDLETRLIQSEKVFEQNLNQTASEMKSNIQSLEQIQSNFSVQLAEGKTFMTTAVEKLKILEEAIENEKSDREAHQLTLEEVLLSLQSRYRDLESSHARLNNSNMILNDNIEVQRMWNAALLKKVNLQNYLHGEMLNEIEHGNNTFEIDFISKHNDGTFFPQDIDGTSKLLLKIISQQNARNKILENLAQQLANFRQGDFVLKISEINETTRNRYESLSENIRNFSSSLIKLQSTIGRKDATLLKTLGNMTSVLARHAKGIEQILRDAESVAEMSNVISQNLTSLDDRLVSMHDQDSARIDAVEKTFDEGLARIRGDLSFLRSNGRSEFEEMNETVKLLRERIEMKHYHSSLNIKLGLLNQTLRNLSDKLHAGSSEINRLITTVIQLKNNPRGLPMTRLGLCKDKSFSEVCDFYFKNYHTGERYLKYDDMILFLFNETAKAKQLRAEFRNVSAKVLTISTEMNISKESIAQTKTDFDVLENTLSNLMTNFSRVHVVLGDQLDSMTQRNQAQTMRIASLENRTFVNTLRLDNTSERFLEIEVFMSANRSDKIDQKLSDLTLKLSDIESQANDILASVVENTESIKAYSSEISATVLHVNDSHSKIQSSQEKIEQKIMMRLNKTEVNTLEKILDTEKKFGSKIAEQEERVSLIEGQTQERHDLDNVMWTALSRHEDDINSLRSFRITLVKSLKNITRPFGPLGLGEMTQFWAFSEASNSSAENLAKCVKSASVAKSAIKRHLSEISIRILTNNVSITQLENDIVTIRDRFAKHKSVLEQIVRENIAIKNTLDGLSSSVLEAEEAIFLQTDKTESLKQELLNKSFSAMNEFSNLSRIVGDLVKVSQANDQKLFNFKSDLLEMKESSISRKNEYESLLESTAGIVQDHANIDALTSELARNMSGTRLILRNMSEVFQSRYRYYSEELGRLEVDMKHVVEDTFQPLAQNVSSNMLFSNILRNDFEEIKNYMVSPTFKRGLLQEMVEDAITLKKRLDSTLPAVALHEEQLRNISINITKIEENVESSVQRVARIEFENLLLKNITRRHQGQIRVHENLAHKLSLSMEVVELRMTSFTAKDSSLENETNILMSSLESVKKSLIRQNTDFKYDQWEHRRILDLHALELRNLSVVVVEMGTHFVAGTERLDLLERRLFNFTDGESDFDDLALENTQEKLSNLSLLVSNDINAMNFTYMSLTELNETIQDQIKYITRSVATDDSVRRELRGNVSANADLLNKLLILITDVQRDRDEKDHYGCRLQNETLTELGNQRAEIEDLIEKLVRHDIFQQQRENSLAQFKDTLRRKMSLFSDEISSLRHTTSEGRIILERHESLIKNQSGYIAEAAADFQNMNKIMSKPNLELIELENKLDNSTEMILSLDRRMNTATTKFEIISEKYEAKEIWFSNSLNNLSNVIRDMAEDSLSRERRLDIVTEKLNLFAENVSEIGDVEEKLRRFTGEFHEKIIQLLYNLTVFRADLYRINETTRKYLNYQSHSNSSLQNYLRRLTVEHENTILNMTSSILNSNVDFSTATLTNDTIEKILSHSRNLESRLTQQEDENRKFSEMFNDLVNNATNERTRIFEQLKILINDILSSRPDTITVQAQSATVSTIEESLNNTMEELAYLKQSYSITSKESSNLAEAVFKINDSVESLLSKLEKMIRENGERTEKVNYLENMFTNGTETLHNLHVVTLKSQDELMRKLHELNQTTSVRSSRYDISLDRLEVAIHRLASRSQENISAVRSSLDNSNTVIHKLKLDVDGNRSDFVAVNLKIHQIHQMFNSVTKDLNDSQGKIMALQGFQERAENNFVNFTWGLLELKNNVAPVSLSIERLENFVQDQRILISEARNNVKALEGSISLLKLEDDLVRSQDDNISASIQGLYSKVTVLSSRISQLNESDAHRTMILMDSNEELLAISSATRTNEMALSKLKVFSSDMFESLQQMTNRTVDNVICETAVLQKQLNAVNQTVLKEIENVLSSLERSKEISNTAIKRNHQTISSTYQALVILNSSFEEIKNKSFQWDLDSALLSDTVEQMGRQMVVINRVEQSMALQKKRQEEFSDSVEKLEKSHKEISWSSEFLRTDLSEMQNQTISCLASKERHENLIENQVLQSIKMNTSMDALKEKISSLILGDIEKEKEIVNATKLLHVVWRRLSNHSEAIQMLSGQTEADRETCFVAITNLSRSLMNLSDSGSLRWEHLGHLDRKYSLIAEKMAIDSNNILEINISISRMQRSLLNLEDQTSSLFEGILEAKNGAANAEQLFRQQFSYDLSALENQTRELVADKEESFREKMAESSITIANLTTLLKTIRVEQKHHAAWINETTNGMIVRRQEIAGLEAKAMRSETRQEDYLNQCRALGRQQNETSVTLEKLRHESNAWSNKTETCLSKNERLAELIGDIKVEFSETSDSFDDIVKRLGLRNDELANSISHQSALSSSLSREIQSASNAMEFMAKDYKAGFSICMDSIRNMSNKIGELETMSSHREKRINHLDSSYLATEEIQDDFAAKIKSLNETARNQSTYQERFTADVMTNLTDRIHRIADTHDLNIHEINDTVRQMIQRMFYDDKQHLSFQKDAREKIHELQRKVLTLQNDSSSSKASIEKHYTLIQEQELRNEKAMQLMRGMEGEISILVTNDINMKLSAENSSKTIAIMSANIQSLYRSTASLSESISASGRKADRLYENYRDVFEMSMNNTRTISYLTAASDQFSQKVDLDALSSATVKNLSLIKDNIENTNRTMLENFGLVANFQAFTNKSIEENRNVISSTLVSLRLITDGLSSRINHMDLSSEAVNKTLQHIDLQLPRITSLEKTVVNLTKHNDQTSDILKRVTSANENVLWSIDMMKEDLREVQNETTAWMAFKERRESVLQNQAVQTMEAVASLDEMKEKISQLKFDDTEMENEINNTASLLRTFIRKLNNQSEVIRILKEWGETERKTWMNTMKNISNTVSYLSKSGATRWDHIRYLDRKCSLLAEKEANNTDAIVHIDISTDAIGRDIKDLRLSTVDLTSRLMHTEENFSNAERSWQTKIRNISKSISFLKNQTVILANENEETLEKVTSQSNILQNLRKKLDEVKMNGDLNSESHNNSVRIQAMRIDAIIDEMTSQSGRIQDNVRNNSKRVSAMENKTVNAIRYFGNEIERVRSTSVQCLAEIERRERLVEQDHEFVEQISNSMMRLKENFTQFVFRESQTMSLIKNNSLSLVTISMESDKTRKLEDLQTTKFALVTKKHTNLSNAVREIATNLTHWTELIDNLKKNFDRMSTNSSRLQRHVEIFGHVTETIRHELTNMNESIKESDQDILSMRQSLAIINETNIQQSDFHIQNVAAFEMRLQSISSAVEKNISANLEFSKEIIAKVDEIWTSVDSHSKEIDETTARLGDVVTGLDSVVLDVQSQDAQLDDFKQQSSDLWQELKIASMNFTERLGDMRNTTAEIQSSVLKHERDIKRHKLRETEVLESLRELRVISLQLTSKQIYLTNKTDNTSTSLSVLEKIVGKYSEAITDIESIKIMGSLRELRVDNMTKKLNEAEKQISNNGAKTEAFTLRVAQKFQTVQNEYISRFEELRNVSDIQTVLRSTTLALEKKCDSVLRSMENMTRKYGHLTDTVVENNLKVDAHDETIKRHSRAIGIIGEFQKNATKERLNLLRGIYQLNNATYRRDKDIKELENHVEYQGALSNKMTSLLNSMRNKTFDVEHKCKLAENATTRNAVSLIKFASKLNRLSKEMDEAAVARAMLLYEVGNLTSEVTSLRQRGKERETEMFRLQDDIQLAKKNITVNVARRLQDLNTTWSGAFESMFLRHLDAKRKHDILKNKLDRQTISLQNLTNVITVLKQETAYIEKMALKLAKQEGRIDAADARLVMQESVLEEASAKIEIFSGFQESLARTVGILGTRIVLFQNETADVALTTQRHEYQIREQNLWNAGMEALSDSTKRKLEFLIEFYHKSLDIPEANNTNSESGVYAEMVTMVSTVHEDLNKLNATAWRMLENSQINNMPVYDGIEYEEYGNEEEKFGGESISEDYLKQYTAGTYDSGDHSVSPTLDLFSHFTEVIRGIENVITFAVPKTTLLFNDLAKRQVSFNNSLLTLNQEIKDVKETQNALDFSAFGRDFARKEHSHENIVEMTNAVTTSIEATNRKMRALEGNFTQKIEQINETILSESQRSTLLLQQILPYMETTQENARTMIVQLNENVTALRHLHDFESSKTELLADEITSLRKTMRVNDARFNEVQKQIEKVSVSSAESVTSLRNGLLSSFNTTSEVFQTDIELLKRGGERRDNLLVNAEKSQRRHSSDILYLNKITENTNSMLNAIVEESKWNGNQIDTCIQNIETLNNEHLIFVSSFQAALRNQSLNIQNLNETVSNWVLTITNSGATVLREPSVPETDDPTQSQKPILPGSNFKTVTANPTSLVLTWTASPSPDISEYRLIIREAIDGGLARPILMEVTDTQVLVDGLTPDTAYLIEIYSVSGAGNLSSDPLTGMSVTAQQVIPTETTSSTSAQVRTKTPSVGPEDSLRIMWQCDFDTPCDIAQSTSDNFDWTLYNGSTPSEDTGPSVDHTRGDIQGSYMYIEASRPRQSGDIARIATTLQPAVDDCCLEFYYHMFGVGAGDLSVMLYSESGRENRIWELSGSQENLWQKQALEFHSDERFRVIFEAVRGSDYHGDLALDDIVLRRGRCPRPAFECDFEEATICGFIQDSTDDFDWDRNKGATSSSDTGPMTDHTSGTPDGYYMFMESSNPRVVNERTRLVGPELSSTDAQCLQFFYHMHGVDINTLNVYLRETRGGMSKLLWSKVGPQGNDWNVARMEISPTSSYRLIFEAIRGQDFHGDVAIDDVTVQDGFCSNPACAIGTAFGDQCYELNDAPKPFAEASAICNSNGGELTAIKTSKQQDFVKDLVTKNSDNWSRFWIGLDDRRREGYLVYSDGTPLAAGLNSFNAWASNEPNDSEGTKDCVAIDIAFKNRRWSTLSCDLEIGFICQYPLSP